MLLGGLLSAARSIIISTDAIDYEVQRTPIARVLIEAPADRLVSRTGARASQLRNVMKEEFIPAHITEPTLRRGILCALRSQPMAGCDRPAPGRRARR